MDFRAGAINTIAAQRTPHPQKTPFRPGRRRVRLPMQLKSRQLRELSGPPALTQSQVRGIVARAMDGDWRPL